MYFSRSFCLATAFLFSFPTGIQSRATYPKKQLRNLDPVQDAYERSGLPRRIPKLFGKRLPAQTCIDDYYLREFEHLEKERAQEFCNILLELPAVTVDVDVTPTTTRIVMTASSFSTITDITHSTTTETTTSTVTSTIPAVLPRAANIQNQIRAFITGLISNGTVSQPDASSMPSAKASISSGLSSACQCINIDPTATTTVTNTAPPLEITMGAFERDVSTFVSTRLYTVTTTVVDTQNATLAPSLTDATSSSPVVDRSLANNTVSGITSNTGSTTTGNPTAVVLVPSATAIEAAPPLVTSLPFSCPEDDSKRITNIIDLLRYEYAVECGLAVATNNTIFSVTVASPTECAAECSFVNDAFQDTTCQIATFSNATGQCLISGDTINFLNSTDSTSVVLLGVYSAADNCTTADLVRGPSNVSIDTSSLIASITRASVSVSTPGFVYSTGTGGVSRAYYSTGATGSDGVYRYSTGEWYASSSQWYAVYSTDWSCSRVVPRTMVIPQSTTATFAGSSNATSLIVNVTTVINGNSTTIMSGTQTSAFVGESSVSLPTSVPASTTSGSDIVSTGGSTLVSSSTNGEGALSPSATAVANQTSLSLSDDATVGSAGATISGGITISNSTGGSGASTLPSTESLANQTSAPLISSGGYSDTVSGGNAMSYNTGDGASILPTVTSNLTSAVESALSGSFVGSVSGGIFTLNSTGTVGSVFPSATILSLVDTISAADSMQNSTVTVGTGGPTAPSTTSGDFVGTLSGATLVLNSTGGGGSAVPSTTSGIFVGANSGRTSTSNSTGSVGTISRVTSPGNSSDVASPTSGGYVNTVSVGTISVISGGISVVSSGNTSLLYSTGGTGSSLLPSSANGTGPTGPTLGSSIASSSESTNTSEIQGFSIAIPTPTPTLNVSTATNGSFIASLSGATAATYSSGGTGVVPPSINATTASATVIPSANDTSGAATLPTSGAFNASLSGGTALTSSTGESGAITPSANVTTPSGTIGSSSNATLTPSDALTSGAANFSVTGGTTVLLATGGTGSILPSANITSAPSVTPSPSVNESETSPPFDFNNSGDNRSGRYRTSSVPLNSTAVGTAPVGTTPIGTAPIGTAPVGTALVETAPAGYPSSNQNSTEAPISSSANATSSSGIQPSITLPPTFSNQTSLLPTGSGSSDFDFNNSNGPRIGSYPSSSASATLFPSSNFTATLVGSASIPPANFTGPAGTASISASIPVSSGNITSSPGTGTASPSSANATTPLGTVTASVPSATNTTDLTLGTESDSILSPSSNATAPAGTGSSAIATPSENPSAPFGSGSITVPAVSANSTGALETGTAFTPTASSLIPEISANSSSLAQSLVTSGIQVTPSATPSISANITSAPTACITEPSTWVEIITITHATTASTCAPSGLSIPSAGANVTLVGAASLSVVPSPAFTTSPSSTLPAFLQHRAQGVTASQAQIDAACANKGNVVFNGDFETPSTGNANGWTSKPASESISFNSFPSTTQHTPNGTYSGRIVSNDVGASVTVSQPLTLCPNTTYNVTSFNRQHDLLAQCRMTYKVGDKVIYSVSPQEFWLLKSGLYTAGSTAQNVSVDLTVGLICRGTSGILFRDVQGRMIAEFDDLSLKAQ